MQQSTVPKYIELLDLSQIELTYKQESIQFEQGKLLMNQDSNTQALGIAIDAESISWIVDSYPIEAKVLMAGKSEANYLQNMKLQQVEEEILLFQYFPIL